MKVISARNHSVKQNPHNNSKDKQYIKLGCRKTQSNQKAKQNTDASHDSHKQSLKQISNMLKPKPIHTANRHLRAESPNYYHPMYPQLFIDVNKGQNDNSEPISPINSIAKIMRADSLEEKKGNTAKNSDRKYQTPIFGNTQNRKLKLFVTNKSPLKINLQ